MKRLGVLAASRRTPLAASVGVLFAISTAELYANTITVTRCDDHDIAGDLRHGVVAAMDGDTVDMSALNCPNSRISLQLGQLATSHDITLLGPGKNQLTITGYYWSGSGPWTIQPYRIIRHNGSGTLTIKDVSLVDGRYSGGGIAAGGCVYSTGSVTLDHAGVYLCHVSATAPGVAIGGGVYTASGLSLRYSTVSGNMAYAGSPGQSTSGGGGAAVRGDFYAFRSTISDNTATGVGSPPGSYAAGLLLFGNVMIFSSAIYGNTAQGPFGGIAIKGGTGSALIGNSTISGNTSLTSAVGGIFTRQVVTTINSSTIAFNTALSGKTGRYAPGLAALVPSGTMSSTVNLSSTLIANNTYGSPAIENDVSTVNVSSATVTISGANNLVRVATASLPVGTISGACPLLRRLRNNGGPTFTHELLGHSPGIDQGNNDNLLPSDQRGPPYARVSGSAADIGAYEIQQDEIVFDAGFEGCPSL